MVCDFAHVPQILRGPYLRPPFYRTLEPRFIPKARSALKCFLFCLVFQGENGRAWGATVAASVVDWWEIRTIWAGPACDEHQRGPDLSART